MGRDILFADIHGTGYEDLPLHQTTSLMVINIWKMLHMSTMSKESLPTQTHLLVSLSSICFLRSYDLDILAVNKSSVKVFKQISSSIVALSSSGDAGMKIFSGDAKHVIEGEASMDGIVQLIYSLCPFLWCAVHSFGPM